MLLTCAGSRDRNIVPPMLRPLARTLAAALAASLAPACTQDNPLFAPISGDDPTTVASVSVSASASTTGEPGLTTAEPGSGSGDGSGTPTTSDVEPGTTSTTTDPIATGTSTGEPVPGTSTGTGEGDTSTGEGDTEDPMAGTVTVIASLATCVLLPNFNFPYLGPLGCEMVAEQADGLGQTGVMLLDTSFDGAGAREARVYLRFEIPPTPEGKAIASATLSVRTSGSLDAGADWSGKLFQVLPFDANTLNFGAPGGTLLTADPGPSSPDTPSTWQIPVPKIVPKQPLYLGLGALDSNGVLYRSTRADEDLKPRLMISYQ